MDTLKRVQELFEQRGIPSRLDDGVLLLQHVAPPFVIHIRLTIDDSMSCIVATIRRQRRDAPHLGRKCSRRLGACPSKHLFAVSCA